MLVFAGASRSPSLLLQWFKLEHCCCWQDSYPVWPELSDHPAASALWYVPPFIFTLFYCVSTDYLSDVSLCMWLHPNQEVQSFVKRWLMSTALLCIKTACVVQTKSVWYTVNFKSHARFHHVFPFCSLAFHSNYCTLIPQLIFQKLMWMPLMYAWKDSFWWSVKEMETFIWSMFHTRESFSPRYECCLIFLRPPSVGLQ